MRLGPTRIRLDRLPVLTHSLHRQLGVSIRIAQVGAIGRIIIQPSGFLITGDSVLNATLGQMSVGEPLIAVGGLRLLLGDFPRADRFAMFPRLSKRKTL